MIICLSDVNDDIDSKLIHWPTQRPPVHQTSETLRGRQLTRQYHYFVPTLASLISFQIRHITKVGIPTNIKQIKKRNHVIIINPFLILTLKSFVFYIFHFHTIIALHQRSINHQSKCIRLLSHLKAKSISRCI